MTLNLQTPFPTFGGSTGGWLRQLKLKKNMQLLGLVKKNKFLKCQQVVLLLCVMVKIYYT